MEEIRERINELEIQLQVVKQQVSSLVQQVKELAQARGVDVGL